MPREQEEDCASFEGKQSKAKERKGLMIVAKLHQFRDRDEGG